MRGQLVPARHQDAVYLCNSPFLLILIPPDAGMNISLQKLKEHRIIRVKQSEPRDQHFLYCPIAIVDHVLPDVPSSILEALIGRGHLRQRPNRGVRASFSPTATFLVSSINESIQV